MVDGGKNLNTSKCPPLIYRQPFPSEWRFIVAVPNLKEGLSNSEENHAFQKLGKMPAEDVGQICRLIMLKLLPALAEHDIEYFGDALTKIQVLTGNYFAQAQGGTYSSPAAAECIAFMKKSGAYGVGQSSWGPALYGVVKQEEAKRCLSKVKAYLRKGVGGEAFIARANNRGASIKLIDEEKAVKVLLITGVLAEDAVKRYAQESDVETEILALKMVVAALLTPQTIANGLKTKKLTGFNMILVPGLVRGDTNVISKVTGVPAFKGPRYAADLPTVLDSLCEIQLSTSVSADDLLREKLQQKAMQEIEKIEKNRVELLKKPGSMLIGDLAIGKEFPMRVLAEIVDAALMDKEIIQQTAKRFVAAGADIIDVGMVAGESQPEKAKCIVEWVKQVVDVPVSIDTLDPAEIKAAVQAGADLVLKR